MEIVNRKAKYDYEIFDTYEVGIALTGNEIKSIRKGSVNLKDSYIIIRNNEAFILNMHITNYDKAVFKKVYWKYIVLFTKKDRT